MTEHTDQTINILEDRDSSVLGTKVQPPYFLGFMINFKRLEVTRLLQKNG